MCHDSKLQLTDEEMEIMTSSIVRTSPRYPLPGTMARDPMCEDLIWVANTQGWVAHRLVNYG